MPKLASPKKELRARKKKTAKNANTKSNFTRIKKKTLKLIEMGETKLAQQQLSHAYKSVDKAAKVNAIHPNKAARVKSQLAKKLNSTSQKNVKTAPKNS